MPPRPRPTPRAPRRVRASVIANVDPRVAPDRERVTPEPTRLPSGAQPQPSQPPRSPRERVHHPPFAIVSADFVD